MASSTSGRTAQSLSIVVPFNLVEWGKAHLEAQDRQPLIDAFAKAGEAPKSEQDLLLMSKDDLKALGLGMFQRNRVFDVISKLKQKVQASTGTGTGSGVATTEAYSASHARNVFCMGSLKKRTVKNVGGLGIWKKRFCQVQDGVFKYWDGDDAKGKFKGTIDMSLVTLVKVSEADHGLSRLAFSVHNATKFEMHLPSKNRVYLWAAHTPAQALEWMHALLTHCPANTKPDPTVLALEKAIEEGHLDPHASSTSPPSTPKSGKSPFSASSPNLLAGQKPDKASPSSPKQQQSQQQQALDDHKHKEEQALRDQALLEKLWKVIDETTVQIESLKAKVDAAILRRTEKGDTSVLDLLGMPVMTCVNCFSDYRVNGEGHCRYHPGDLTYKQSGNNYYAFTCCSESSYDWSTGLGVAGCSKSKHEPATHSKYPHVFAEKYALYKEAKLHDQKYLSVVQTDFYNDAVDYELQAGNRTDGKLYLRALKGSDTISYHKFTAEQVIKGATSPDIYSHETKEGLRLSMKWVLDGSKITGLDFSVQVPRCATALHRKAALRVTQESDQDTFECDQVETLSDPATTPLPTFALTPLADLKPKRIALETKETKVHISSGSGPFKIEMIPADKSIDTPWSSEANSVVQCFRDNLRLSNGEDKRAITNITAAFWRDGKWQDVTQLFIGSMTTGWRNDRQFNADNRIIPLNVDSKISFDIALVSRISINPARSIDHKDIINPAFGEPVIIQYTITTSDGGVNQLVSEFVSRKLDFYDITGWMKDNSVASRDQVALYVECDDVDVLKRYRYVVWLTKDKELHIRMLQSSTYHSFTQRNLRIIGAKAAKENKKEVEVGELYTEGQEPNKCTFQAWFLVDVDTALVYGVRVHLKTTTGENQGSCLIPYDGIKER